MPTRPSRGFSNAKAHPHLRWAFRAAARRSARTPPARCHSPVWSEPGIARGMRHEDARSGAFAHDQDRVTILTTRQPSRNSLATGAYRLISVVAGRPAGSSASYRPAEGISGPPICLSCRLPVFEFPCCCASGPWTSSFSVVVRPWRGLSFYCETSQADRLNRGARLSAPPVAPSVLLCPRKIRIPRSTLRFVCRNDHQ